jgi:hypothetical protein
VCVPLSAGWAPPGRARQAQGDPIMIGQRIRTVIDRVVTVAGIGLLALFVSLRATADDADQTRDAVAAVRRSTVTLAYRGRYGIGHLGAPAVDSAAMIMIELVATMALITILIGWADRRIARRRPTAMPSLQSHRRSGKDR